jgi:hypothetical protein
MRRTLATTALLVLVAAGLPGCIAVVSDQPDPIHADKLLELERRMDGVEAKLPK